MAVGAALLFNIKLPINFNSPYKADNLGNFWKRWHISLSSWLKDYLYIPLGGNRKGKFRTNVNLMLTMLLGGLWHGASWEFVIWGGLNGIGLLIYKYWKNVSPYEHSTHWATHLWKVFLTFNFITFTRIWFRSESIQQANQFMSQVWNNLDLNMVGDVILSYYKVFLLMALGYIVHWLPSSLKNSYRNWFINSAIWVKLIIAVLIVFVIYQSYSADIVPFIYFQF